MKDRLIGKRIPLPDFRRGRGAAFKAHVAALVKAQRERAQRAPHRRAIFDLRNREAAE